MGRALCDPRREIAEGLMGEAVRPKGDVAVPENIPQ
jgi:hypothetical protein